MPDASSAIPHTDIVLEMRLFAILPLQANAGPGGPRRRVSISCVEMISEVCHGGDMAGSVVLGIGWTVAKE